MVGDPQVEEAMPGYGSFISQLICFVAPMRGSGGQSLATGCPVSVSGQTPRLGHKYSGSIAAQLHAASVSQDLVSASTHCRTSHLLHAGYCFILDDIT